MNNKKLCNVLCVMCYVIKVLVFVHFTFHISHFTNLYGAFDEFSPGVRPAALGGAFIAISDDANAVFYNPAGLYRITQNELLASLGRLYVGLDDESNISNSVVSYLNPFGKYGTAGLGMSTLSLSSLYTEKIISFSYGLRLVPKLGIGLTMKSLSHEYGSDTYTENAIDDTGNALGEPDPVFENGKLKSQLSSDFGLFYRPESKYNLGLVIQNLNSPDIGLKESDKVEKTSRAGFAYTSKRANLAVEVMSRNDKTNFIAGFEKYFLKDGIKIFALRGALTFGSDTLRRFSIGFGLDQKKYRLDYVFLYPLVGINDMYGSHKVSFSVLFGPIPKVEQLAAEFPPEIEIEEKLAVEEKLPTTPSVPLPTVRAITDNDRLASELLIKDTQYAYRKGLYAKATENIIRAIGLDPDNQGARTINKKLQPIASIIREKTESTKTAKIVRKGITAYLENNPEMAVNAIRYATELSPDDIALQQVFELIAKEYPETASQEKSIPGLTLVDKKLQQALENIYAGKYVQAIAECNTVLELEEDNVTALQRLGSAYFAIGDVEKARAAWRTALKYDPNNPQILEFLQEKPAATPIPKIEKPKSYVVQKGDSLPDIAQKVYGDKSQWRKIYDANRDKLKNPYSLFIGQELTIP
ncbi:MAG: tetratricopeptide repeat protein [Elusimicrobiota bacterium]